MCPWELQTTPTSGYEERSDATSEEETSSPVDPAQSFGERKTFLPLEMMGIQADWKWLSRMNQNLKIMMIIGLGYLQAEKLLNAIG